MTMRRTARAVAGTIATMAMLAACSSETDSTNESGDTTNAETREVTDLQGTVTVPTDPQAIVATDNRIFRALDEWGVELVAAPIQLLPPDVSYGENADIIDLGSHREPNLEGIVEAQPDLILNGQRFAQHYADIESLAGDAALVDINIDQEAPLADELRRQITLLGEILGHEDDAEAMVADFDDAIAAAEEAYNPDDTVMGLLTSGGDISYSAPSTGRSVGPVFDMVGLTPALDQEAGDVSHGDDISVEAIASANPDWLLVLDRDAAVTVEGEEFSSAQELIEESEALQDVTAVKEGQIIYLEASFYKTEDIQAYTKLLNDMADAFSAAD